MSSGLCGCVFFFLGLRCQSQWRDCCFRTRLGEPCLKTYPLECVDVLKRARVAFRAGRTLKEGFRLAQLEAVVQMLEEHECDFVDALGRDLHKVRRAKSLTDSLNCCLYLFYIYFNWMSLLLLKYDFWAPSTTLPLKWLTGPNSHFYRIHPLFVFQPAALWDSRVRTDSGEERGASCHQQPEEVDAAAACGKKPGGTFLCFAKLHKHLHNIIRIIMRN